ncbi:hypothetical protein ECANGB1_2150 [Enterospora canceri]|uniref:Uncharacterized protein n=1 Tax=Enterospora canceri TaxID=1081671 RepID=A0A1Y1S5R0_9MICR|nr:hypothetical protein ECANGB1_2150 [Enterospora canceri]
MIVVIWLWMIHLLSINCGKDANYQKLKTEYDKLQTTNTMSPSKKYRDNTIIFPDVKWDDDIDKIELVEIKSTGNDISTTDLLGLNDALRNTIRGKITEFLTPDTNPNNLNKDDIVHFFATDSTTAMKFEAAITQLEALIEKQGNAKTRLMHEEIEKAMTKMGNDCKLSAKEKRESLDKHFMQLPYYLSINIDIISNFTTYMYVVFTAGNKTMKSEIITLTRDNNKIQTIHNLEEYEVKITKKATTKVKPQKKKEASKKKETTKKKGASKKGKMVLTIIWAVAGIMLLSIGITILMRKRKTREEVVDLE